MRQQQVKSAFTFAFISTGFAAMISQITLLRELIILFTGNELVIGIILATWLFWTAAGSGILGRLTSGIKNSKLLFILLQLFLAALIPATFLFVNSARKIFSISPGEIISPLFVFLIPFIALSFVGLAIGFLYTLGCKVLTILDSTIELVPGKIYFYEAIGSGIAGFIASIFIFQFLENIQVILIISLFNLLVGFFMICFLYPKLRLKLLLPVVVLMILIIKFFPAWNITAQKLSWGKLELLKIKTSIYGNLTAVRVGETISFYENGVLMFTHPDLMHDEESVHFALLQHPFPEQVLLVGGNLPGSIPQVLAHKSVKNVDICLLDPESLELTKEFIPHISEIIHDDRINVFHTDGRRFIERSSDKYDVIIINLPTPQTTQINRFYSLEFYQIVKEKLESDGILSFSIGGSENALIDEQTEVLSCLHRTLKQVFEETILIPGYSIHLISCNSTDILNKSPEILNSRITSRNLATKYMKPYYLNYRLTEPRIKFLEEQIKEYPSKIINRDFKPIGAFLSVYLWLSSFNKKLIGTIQEFRSVITYFTYIVLLLFLLLISYFVFKNKKLKIETPVIITMFMVGSTSISLEILLIHGFQAIYGYAYFQIALILSGFMIGLALGSWFAITRPKPDNPWRIFFQMQILFFLYPLFSYLLLILVSAIILPDIFVQIIFLFLICVIGFITGHQFPLANKLMLSDKMKTERVGGALYAWELTGSIFGALFFSTLIIPVFGVGFSCLFLSLANALPIVLLKAETAFRN